MGNIVQLNEGEIKNQLGEMVRQSVEDTLNSMLDAEADQITNAHRYERTEGQGDTFVPIGLVSASTSRSLPAP